MVISDIIDLSGWSHSKTALAGLENLAISINIQYGDDTLTGHE
ncbi:hypothetical protein [Ketobacter sp.]